MANFKVKNGITLGANGITFSDGSIQTAAPAGNTTGSSSNTSGTLVLRNSSGGFSAGAITAESFSGNGANISNLNASNLTSGTLSNDRTTATENNTANTIVLRDSSGSFSANNITITGNLIVSGTYTTVNTEIIDLADNKIVLNSNHTGSPTEDAGLIVNRGSSSNVELIWNETEDYWSVGNLNFQANNFIGNLNASNLTSGTINDARFPSSGVTAGSYGNSSYSAQIVTDTYGRITSASNVAIQISYSAVTGLENSATIISSSSNGASTIVSRDASGSFAANTITATTVSGSFIGEGDLLQNINASNLTSGTISSARLPTSGVSAGTYGSSSLVPQIVVDTYGRVTSVANVGFSLAAANVSGLATSATTDTTNASNITTGTLANARTTAASANGASTIVSRDASGSFTANTITATTVSGSFIGEGGLLQNINASSIMYGTLSSARLPTTGVSAGTYGSSSLVPQIVVDTYGRVTSVANVGFSLAAANVSGLATSATTDTTNASNITTGTLANARTTAASANGASTIVSRDASGSFTANTITATTVSGSFIGEGGLLQNINASSIMYGTLSSARLPTTGVSAGTYGNSSNTVQIVVDTYGRITSIANSAINSSGGTRVTTVSSASSVTMNANTSDMVTQNNTGSGTLTINAPTGTPSDGQKIMFRLKSTNVLTFSFNAIFQGSTDLPLPTSSSGSNKYDYLGFIYNSDATKWQYIAKIFGF